MTRCAQPTHVRARARSIAPTRRHERDARRRRARHRRTAGRHPPHQSPRKSAQAQASSARCLAAGACARTPTPTRPRTRDGVPKSPPNKARAADARAAGAPSGASRRTSRRQQQRRRARARAARYCSNCKPTHAQARACARNKTSRAPRHRYTAPFNALPQPRGGKAAAAWTKRHTAPARRRNARSRCEARARAHPRARALTRVAHSRSRKEPNGRRARDRPRQRRRRRRRRAVGCQSAALRGQRARARVARAARACATRSGPVQGGSALPAAFYAAGARPTLPCDCAASGGAAANTSTAVTPRAAEVRRA
jgi:hypothetical protein